ncbi:MAG: mevalonate kinase [Anaerolineales bacterium]|nr:mevalonate kinase [Anaerolineales bacterium]
MSIGEAPGKIILLGEHAVVHGHPALAAPVHQVRARAELVVPGGEPLPDLRVEAPDVGLSVWLYELAPDSAIARALRLTQQALGLPALPQARLHLTSTIPVASGLGSGAAITLAIVRALSAHANRALSLEEQSAIVYEVDKIHHGTPSGIDNTVITYGVPIRYQIGAPVQRLQPGVGLPLLIADSGTPSPTGHAVAHVRARLQHSPRQTQSAFDSIHQLVERGALAVQSGDLEDLGGCMSANHAQLQALGVSTPVLDQLVAAAQEAGALGAKLSGAGMGGNVVALVPLSSTAAVTQALRQAGAARILQTEVPA